MKDKKLTGKSKKKTLKWLMVIIICNHMLLPNVFSQNWVNQVIPIQTSVDEIEKILIADNIKANVVKDPEIKDSYLFQFEEGTLAVYFSLGHCIDGFYGKFELERGKIIQASFISKNWRELSYYEKDIKSLKKEFDGALWHYTNVKRGIEYVIQHDKVSDITFSTPKGKKLVPCKDN